MLTTGLAGAASGRWSPPETPRKPAQPVKAQAERNLGVRVLKFWRAGVATIAVALLSSALIGLDLSDGAFRRWWSARAFTTDAIAGILVVLITVLIVNQVLR